MTKKAVLILAPALALLALGVFNVAAKIAWHEPTDGVLWQERAGGLTAVRVETDGPAMLSGIKAGDILISIRFMESPNLVRSRIDVVKLHWVAFNLDQPVIYEINRNGTLIFPNLFLQRKGLEATYFYPALVGLTAIVIGLLVLFGARRRLAFPHVFFYALTLSFASFYLLSPTGEMTGLDTLCYAVDKLTFLAFPPMLLHFFLIFPLRQRSLKARPAVAIYLPAAALLLARVAYHLPFTSGLGDAVVLRFRDALERLELLHFGAFSLAALAVVLAGARRTPSGLAQRQLRLVGTGLGLGVLPFAVFYIIPFLAGRAPAGLTELTVLLQAVIPLTFAYSISRYKLMDFEILLKKAVIVLFSFFVIASLYLLVSTQTRLLADSGFVLLGILAILLGATLFAPLRKLVQSLLDRAIYRRSYEYRKTLLFISQEIGRERNLHTLAASLLEAIANALALRTIALLLAEDEDDRSLEVLGARGDTRELPGRLRLDEAAAALLREREHLSYYAFEDRRDLSRSLEEFFGCGLVHLLPLRVEDKVVGVLAMGGKSDGSYLTADDWELLTTISPSVALALENASLYNRESVRTREMQRLKDYSENIIESLNVGVAVIDGQDRIIGWNRVLESVFGRTKGEALNRRLSEVLGPANTASLFPPDTQQGYRLLSEVTLETRDGTRRIFDIARTPLLDNTLRPYGTIVVFEDISDKIHLQQQLLTSEKLASIGLLSAGVAHEINTPLTGISSYIQMLQKSLTDAHYGQILAKIETQTDRVARIVKNLLTFARNPAEAAFHRVDLKESLEEIVSLIDYRLKTLRIGLDLRLEPVPPVYAQGERLQQVFINIILNALDAMPQGGTLRIELAPRGADAVVRITDTGLGIKPEHRPHIFDPFFTTKGIGKGTGLGLSISYAIIKEHEGQIEVESEPGRGSVFIITIPSNPDRPRPDKPPAART